MVDFYQIALIIVGILVPFLLIQNFLFSFLIYDLTSTHKINPTHILTIESQGLQGVSNVAVAITDGHTTVSINSTSDPILKQSITHSKSLDYHFYKIPRMLPNDKIIFYINVTGSPNNSNPVFVKSNELKGLPKSFFDNLNINLILLFIVFTAILELAIIIRFTIREVIPFLRRIMRRWQARHYRGAV